MAPRLEDAYLGAVGGIDKRPSPYARLPGVAGGEGAPAGKAALTAGPRIRTRAAAAERPGNLDAGGRLA